MVYVVYFKDGTIANVFTKYKKALQSMADNKDDYNEDIDEFTTISGDKLNLVQSFYKVIRLILIALAYIVGIGVVSVLFMKYIYFLIGFISIINI